GTKQDARGVEFVRANPEIVGPIERTRAAAIGITDIPRKFIGVIARPEAQTQAGLLQVVQTGDAPGLGGRAILFL
ncbi:MAG: hypothetical protein WCO84_08350, partial [bacterium]